MAKNDEKPIRLGEAQQCLVQGGRPGGKLKPPSATKLLPPQWIAPIRPAPKAPAPPTPPQNEKQG